MYLNCPDEVARYVVATLRDLLADPAVDARIGDRHMRIRIGLVDPDCVLIVDTSAHSVRMSDDGDLADGLIAMDGDTALACLLGRRDIAHAIETGAVHAVGASRALLEVLAADAGTSACCEDVLRREGRADLLAVAC
jgi:hypothetical protein